MTTTDRLAAHDTRRYMAGGAEVFARMWSGRDPLILVLHGWGSRGERWLPVAAKLAETGHAVCLPDFPGFGESPPPPAPWSVEDYARAIDGVVSELRSSGAVIVAHSFGARIAVRLASSGRAGVRAMLLMGAAGLRPRISVKRKLFARAARAGNAVFALPPLRPAADLARRALYRMAGSMDYYLAQGVMRETFKLVIDEDLADDMRAVSVPTTLLWGALDRSTPLQDGRRMAELISGAELKVIDDATHALPYARPDLILTETAALIARVGRA